MNMQARCNPIPMYPLIMKFEFTIIDYGFTFTGME